ncbi:MAG: alkaline phosphatase family protein [Cetobacterium sp.]|uniref:alkaline phosphatase family protein n=2 Tax=Cetobacterium sp. TaxID=2071632 RepID=UPI003EE4DACF
MRKLILVLIDGMGDHVSHKMGYLKALESANMGEKFTLLSELPSLSRPLYETILTGKTPIESGIINNQINRMSKEESIFSLAKKSNLKTAAVAYHWVHELYNGFFNIEEDIEVEDLEKNINYGRFYWEDSYPDSHLFSLTNKLIKDKNPDFLLLHTMNIDDAGHKYGGLSKKYENRVHKLNYYFSHYIPMWQEAGYEIVITSDHGMDEKGNHGGDSKLEREVPLWILGDISKDYKERKIYQKDIKGICCEILGIS